MALSQRSVEVPSITPSATGHQPLILGTGGHVDHGKTTLVKSLTGVNTDRLKEERLRGISIELGYAPLTLPSGMRISVVDVPGHERFVRTMVAGATGVDIFLLVVDSNEGPMPQTYEHLSIFKLLGVKTGLIALNKIDIVGEERQITVMDEIDEMLGYTGYKDIEVHKVSATEGTGVAELARRIEEVAQGKIGRPRPGLEGAARLHIDRSFTIKGAGTVVTGTLWSGEITKGETVWVLPKKLQARVKAIQVHDQGQQRVVAGQRVALNLAGVSAEEVKRGDAVIPFNCEMEPSFIFEVDFELLPKARPVRRNARVHVHHGTRESAAKIAAVDSGLTAIQPGEKLPVRLRLEGPLLVSEGDCVIVRTVAPKTTVGGGVITEVSPLYGTPEDAEKRKEIARSRRLEGDQRPQYEGPRGDELLVLYIKQVKQALRLLEMDGAKPRRPASIAGVVKVNNNVMDKLLDELTRRGKLVRAGDKTYYNPDVYKKIEQLIVETCKSEGEITIAKLRDITGTSRRYAQALLTHFNRRRILIRDGDVHRLRPGREL